MSADAPALAAYLTPLFEHESGREIAVRRQTDGAVLHMVLVERLGRPTWRGRVCDHRWLAHISAKPQWQPVPASPRARRSA